MRSNTLILKVDWGYRMPDASLKPGMACGHIFLAPPKKNIIILRMCLLSIILATLLFVVCHDPLHIQANQNKDPTRTWFLTFFSSFSFSFGFHRKSWDCTSKSLWNGHGSWHKTEQKACYPGSVLLRFCIFLLNVFLNLFSFNKKKKKTVCSFVVVCFVFFSSFFYFLAVDVLRKKKVMALQEGEGDYFPF